MATRQNDHLNGDPKDFPNRQEAMDEYRALWFQFLMGESENFLLIEGLNRRIPTEELCKRMDACQSQICRGPGSFWKEFAASLPGYEAWWDGAGIDAMVAIEQVLSKDRQ